MFVLAIGIDRYQAPTNNLTGCANDAQGMLQVFKKQEGKQFERVEGHLLVDSRATGNGIAEGFEALQKKGRSGDWYVLLMSGHGGIVGSDWAFLAHDNRNIRGTDILSLADRLAGAGKKILIIIDACHAGQLRYAAGDILNRHAQADRGGIILMASSMPEQTSAALHQYSAFARAVEDGLHGLADFDNDNLVTLKELRRFTYHRTYELLLKNRLYPGITVRNQDSTIDASLSIPENLPLVHAQKSTLAATVDEGTDLANPILTGKSWKMSTTPGNNHPPVHFELKLDSGGAYRATLMEGTRLLKVSNGQYRVKSKAVHLVHPQGVDRLETSAISPGEFRFRFQGRDFALHCDPPGTLLVDVSGRLAPEDPRDRLRKDSPHKSHLVSLEAGYKYVVNLVSSDFDSYLRLEDDSGNHLAADDDGGGGRNARLRFTAPRGGQYRIIATTYSGGSGVYSLQAEKMPGLPVATLVAARAAEPLVNQTHYLTANDPRDRLRTNSCCREHRLELRAGVTYTIHMLSADFDTYLRLENSAREVLADDDDSGGNLNARIVFTPRATGTYIVIATSYRPAAGRYTLTVNSR